MNKSIELPQLTIKALQDGASIMIVPCKVECMALKGDIPCALTLEQKAIPLIEFSSLQAGDKNVFVKEEFIGNIGNCENYCWYKADDSQGEYYREKWQPASQMTKEQSRFSIDVNDVRVVRVQDLTVLGVLGLEWIVNGETWGTFRQDIEYHFNNLMQEYEDTHFTETGEKISLGRYEDSPYVFLYDVKVTTKEFYKETKDK